jgi:mono/diheme cytochrome c family protein
LRKTAANGYPVEVYEENVMLLKHGKDTVIAVVVVGLGLISTAAHAGPGHSGPHGHDNLQVLEQMREMHREHTHEHDFKAIEEMSPEATERLINFMRDIGLTLPPMDSHKGHQLFMNKGCVACHSVNGVGGDTGPSLDAGDMPAPMNAFEFAARMWKGAPAMVQRQQEELGDVIKLTGQELADLIAFVHDDKMQRTVKLSDVPKKWRPKLR